MKYRVRIGKKRNAVYVRTPKGRVLRHTRELDSREHAKELAARVRHHLKDCGTLTRSHWTVIK